MGNVYFVKCSGLVKIGFASDVGERLSQLQTGNPRGLAVVAVLTGVLPSVEKHYHRAFADLRERGECFRFEGRLAAVIKHIQGGARPVTPAAIAYYLPLPKPSKIKDPRQGEVGRLHGEFRVRLRHGEKYAALRAEFMAKGPDHEKVVAAYERKHPELTRAKKPS